MEKVIVYHRVTDTKGERVRGSPHLNKSCAAGVTAVRLLSRVNARVSLQVSWSIELSTTHVTTVRLVTCKSNDHCYILVLNV